MVDIINICKTFNKGTPDEKRALDNMNLHLDDGDFITIIGGNGAGKSTLFNAICGNFYVDEGKIIIDDEDVTYLESYKRAKKVGYLFQDPKMGTAPNMTILENLSLAYKRSNKNKSIFGINKKDKEFFISELEKLDLNLENRLTTKVGLLSGGQRQALSLLMSTIANPKLLLLDEHTAALDPETSIKIEQLTEKIIKEHKITCLMITHNINSALKMGNKTIMVDKGKVAFELNEEKFDMNTEDLLRLFKEKMHYEMLI